MKIGILSSPGTGHLNPLNTISLALQERGHQIVFFSTIDAQDRILSRFKFCPLGLDEFPLGSVPEFESKIGKFQGLKVFRHTIDTYLTGLCRIFLQEAPKAIVQENLDGLIIDQILFSGKTIAEVTDVPFVSCCGALMAHFDLQSPPGIFDWNFNPSLYGKIRNSAGYLLGFILSKPMVKVTSNYRKYQKLRPLSDLTKAGFSDLAVILQHPKALEFPRPFQTHFHFVGPLTNAKARKTVDFPWESLTNQPIIYASLGTIHSHLTHVYKIIASACKDLGYQLILSLGGAKNNLGELPGSPIVVPYAPQLDLLQKAALFISHCGLNGTLEALRNAVPIVGIPIANDQFGIAQRISFSGCGEAVPIRALTIARLRTSILKVLQDPSYRQNAIAMQAAIRQSGGVTTAVQIIEQALATGQPVLTTKSYSIQI